MSEVEEQINYIKVLRDLGLTNNDLTHITGKSMPTIYRHEEYPEKLNKLECMGYEKLIELQS